MSPTAPFVTRVGYGTGVGLGVGVGVGSGVGLGVGVGTAVAATGVTDGSALGSASAVFVPFPPHASMKSMPSSNAAHARRLFAVIPCFDFRIIRLPRG